MNFEKKQQFNQPTKMSIESEKALFEKDIVQAAKKAYKSVAKNWGAVRGKSWWERNFGADPAEKGQCAWVCKDMLKILQESEKSEDRNYDLTRVDVTGKNYGHIFLELKDGSRLWLVDPTFQQYVDEDERKNLPYVLILPITTIEELKKGLLNYNIGEEYHPIWTEHFFGKKKDELSLT